MCCIITYFTCVWYEGDKDYSFLDDATVQILVVVASSQVRNLTADVRKGFNAIVFSIEWVDLKTSPKWSKRRNTTIYIPSVGWKGNRLKFLYMVYGYVKVTLKEHYDNNKSPNQSSLFCLKVKINMRYAKTCFLLFHIW